MKKVMLPMIEKGHLTKECKLQSKVCVHCGENKKYNRSLWPQKFGTTMKLGTERNEKNTPHKKLQLERKKLRKLHLQWLKILKYCTMKKQEY